MTFAARPNYRQDFLETRLAMIQATLGKLTQAHHPHAREAVKSLQTAAMRAAKIKADLCVGYLDAWQHDDRNWQERLVNLSTAASDLQALDELDLPNGITCGYEG